MPDETYNDALSRLERSVKWSKGRFSLILTCCNYAALRGQIIEQLNEACPDLNIRQITVRPRTRSLRALASEEIETDTPDAVMILGLESAVNPDEIFRDANHARENFRKSFPLPVILWLTEPLLKRLIRSVPDFYSWAGTSLRFRPSDEELSDALQRNVEDMFAEILGRGVYPPRSPADLSDLREFDSFLKDLEPLNITSPCLLFLKGRYAQKSGQKDAAVKFYKECLSLWKAQNEPEREPVLLYLMGQCCEKETAKAFFQDCVRKSAQCQELSAKCLCELCGVLKELGEWEELETTAQEALNLNQTCGKSDECLRCQLFLAEAALQLKDGDLEKAADIAGDILNALYPGEEKNRLVPDQAKEILEQVLHTVNTRKKYPEFDPKFWSGWLNLLHQIYFRQKQYREAFQAKLERYSLEQQFGLRAFVGAGRLKARRQDRSHDISVAEEIEASGRRDDIKKLTERLSEDSCKLIVFHGVSGVGKSSILEAGLVPALRQDKLRTYQQVVPVLIRRYPNWREELGRAVSDAFAEFSDKPEISGVSDLLSDAARHTLEDRQAVAVLIFDQFEEFFFEYPDIKARRPFYEFLKEALDKTSPIKIIFSLREDYIHYLLEWDQYIQVQVDFDILGKNFRIYLGNFTREGAKEVIRSLTRRSHFPLDEGLIDQVVDDLAEDEDKGIRPIELQIVGSQIEAEEIHTREDFRPKAEMVRAFLKEAVHDCGTENEEIARLVLYLLTDEKLTRPLKTRAEIEYELRGVISDTGLEIRDEQLTLVLKILTLSNMIFLISGETDKYQLVHDYLTGPVREETKPLLEKLDTDRKDREFERRLAEQAERQKQEQAERERERQQRQLRIALAAGVVFAVVAAVAIFFGFEAKDAAQRANRNLIMADFLGLEAKDAAIRAHRNLRKAEKAEQEATKNLLQANYNLAKAFEEKAGLLIENAKNTQDYQKAWLFTLAALQQDIGDRNLPVSSGRLAMAELREGISPWLWQSPNPANSHSSVFTSVVSFSPDGQRIACGSGFDEAVRVWDAKTGKEIMRFSGHLYGVKSVSFSPDGHRIASGGDDETVRVWDADTGKELARFFNYSSYLNSMSFSPDGQRIASGSCDNTMRMWDTETGKELMQFSGHSSSVSSVSFSPDGRRIVSGSPDKTGRVWDAGNGRELTRFSGHSDGVISVSFSPDGRRIASGSLDDTVRVWDADTGEEITRLTGHSSGVSSVSFSPDGRRIASGSLDDTVRVWDADIGEEITRLTGHSSGVSSVSFSPDGRRIASGSYDKTVRIWNAENVGKEFTRFSKHSSDITSLAFSPNGDRIASGSSDKTVRVWDADTGKSLMRFSGHSSEVWDVSFSSDGRRIVSGSPDKTVRVWDAETGKEFTRFFGHSFSVRSVSFSPDGRRIASGSLDQTTMRVWHAETGKELTHLFGHPHYFGSVSFSSDGRRVVSGPDDTVWVWDAETGRELMQFSGHSHNVTRVSLSPDGQLFVSGPDDAVWVWDAETGKELTRFSGHSDNVTSLSFSPDGQRIASASGDGTVCVWDAETGKELTRFSGHSDNVTSLSFSPAGQSIASGSLDRTVRVWDAETGEELTRFSGLSDDVVSVSFSPSGRSIASSDGKMIRIWKLDLLNAYLKHGKDSPLFKKICQVSFTVLPFHLEGITMVPSGRRFLPLRGQPNPWKVVERPRPPHKDPVEWMIENIDRMDAPD